MSNSQEFVLKIKALFDANDVKSKIGDMQKSLSNIKLSDQLKRNITDAFGDANKSLEAFLTKLNQGVNSKSDAKGLSQSFTQVTQSLKNLSKVYEQVRGELGTEVDLSKLIKIDSDTTRVLKEVEQEVAALDSEIQEINAEKLGQLQEILGRIKSKGASGAATKAIELFNNGELEQAIALLDEAIQKQQRIQATAEAGSSRAKTIEHNIEELGNLEKVINQAITDSSNVSTRRQEALARATEAATQAFQKEYNAVMNGGDAVQDYVHEAEQVGPTIKSAAEEQSNFVKEVDQLKSRIQYFFGLSNAVNLFKRALHGAFETIKSLDKAMTETAVVTNFTVQDMWKQLPQYTAMANSLGVTTQAAYESATLFYQQGLETEQVMALSVETLKMARIAGLDAAEATDRMTNALRGFNMELNTTNAQRVDDVYSNLAARTASNVDEISTAMTKVASLAHNANMEFETTAAFLAQIIESTRESAETAGTALKTVVARFSEVKKLYSEDELSGKDEEGEIINVNKISTALRTAGIDLNKYFLGEVGLDDIFMELASKWDSLTKVQQRYIATQAAGSRQQSRFIALMQDYARTQDLVGYAYNANGAAAEQFGKTQESLESKLARLKNAWNEFLMGLTNSDVVKGAVDTLTNLLNWLNKITDSSEGLAKSFKKWGVVLAGFGGLRAVLGKGGLLNSLLSIDVINPVKWGSKLGSQLTKGLLKTINVNTGNKIFKGFFETATTGAAIAGKETGGAFVKSLIAAVASNPTTALAIAGITAAIGLAVAGIKALMKSAYDKSIEGQIEAAKKKSEELAETSKELGDTISDLKTRYEGLQDAQEVFESATIGTQEWQDALQEVNNQINDIIAQYPNLAQFASWENVNGSWMRTIDDEVLQQTLTTMSESQKYVDSMSTFWTTFSSQLKTGELINAAKQFDYFQSMYAQETGQQYQRIFSEEYEAEWESAKTSVDINTGFNNAINTLSDIFLDQFDFSSFREWYQDETFSLIEPEEILSILGYNTSTQENALKYYVDSLLTDSFRSQEGSSAAAAAFSKYGLQPYTVATNYDELVNKYTNNQYDALQKYSELTNGAIFTGDIEQLPKIVASLEQGSEIFEEIQDVQEIASQYNLFDELAILAGNYEEAKDDLLQGIDEQKEGLDELFKALGITNTEWAAAVKNIKDLRNVARGRWVEKFAKSLERVGTSLEDTSSIPEKILNLFADTGNWADQLELGNFLDSIEGSEYEGALLDKLLETDPEHIADILSTYGEIDVSDKFTILAAVRVGDITADAAQEIGWSEDSITSADWLEHLLTSESFEGVEKELNSLIEKNGEITSENIDELAESSSILREYLDETTMSAEGLAAVLTGLQSGTITMEGLTDTVLDAVASFDSLDAMVNSTLNTINNFKAGTDEGKVADFFGSAYDTINELWENGEVGNSQIDAYIEAIYGRDFLRGKSGDERAAAIEQAISELSQVKEEGNLLSYWSRLIDSGLSNDISWNGEEVQVDFDGRTIEQFIDDLYNELNPNGEEGYWTKDLLHFMLTDFANNSLNARAELDQASYDTAIREFGEGIQENHGGYITQSELDTQATLMNITVEELIKALGLAEDKILDFSEGADIISKLPSDIQGILGDTKNIDYSALKQAFSEYGFDDYFDAFVETLKTEGATFQVNGQELTVDEGESVSEAAKNASTDVAIQDIQGNTTSMVDLLTAINNQLTNPAKIESLQQELQGYAAKGQQALDQGDWATAIVYWSQSKAALEELNNLAAETPSLSQADQESLNNFGQTIIQNLLDGVKSLRSGDYSIAYSSEREALIKNFENFDPTSISSFDTLLESYNNLITKLQSLGLSDDNINFIKNGLPYDLQTLLGITSSEVYSSEWETLINDFENFDPTSISSFDTLLESYNNLITKLQNLGFDEDSIQSIEDTLPDDLQVLLGITPDEEEATTAGDEITETVQEVLIKNPAKAGVISDTGAAYQTGVVDAMAYTRGFNSTVGATRRPLSGAFGASMAAGGLIRSAAGGTQKPGPTLTGEEGQELVWNKEKGYAYLTGVDYPEIRDLQPGDRVFDARMTKKILGSMASGGIIGSAATGYGKKKPTTSSSSSSGSSSKSKGSSSGSGSKSSSDDEKKWQNQLDWLYNVMEDITELERIQTKLQEDYDDYLKDQSKTGKDLYNLLINQLGNLYTQLDHQTFVLEKREQEMREFMDTTNKYDQYLWYNWNDRTLEIDWDGIEAIQDEETYKEVSDLVSEAEKIQKNMDTAEDAITKIQNQIDELENIWRETFTDFEDRVLDALIKSYQQVIDNFSELNTTLNNSNNEILNSIQKEISLARQIRDNTKTEEGIADSEARLAFLRRDTTGGNQLAAMQLEKELAESRQDYEDTLVDQAISRLQDDNDAAAQQREKQIEIMQAQLDYQSESGEFNAAVRELLESAIGDNGELLTNSDLVDLLQKQENWQAMSDVSKEVWEEELNSTFKEVAAFLLKENAQENGTFITALTGAVQGVSAVIGSYSQAMQKLGQTVTKAASSGGGGGGSSGGGNSGGGSGGGNTPGTQPTATTSALKNPVRVLQETTTTVKGFADVLKKVTSTTTNSPFKIPGRKNGGLVSQTGIGLLHGTISEPEYVLNARQTDAFLRLADVLPSLMSGDSTSTSNMFGGINLNLVMNVDEIGSDYDVDRIANRVKDIIYNASTYRNVNTLSLTR